MTGMSKTSERTRSELALEEIYREIPSIPGCDGRCAVACGPIAMYEGEWARIVRSRGATTPRLAPGSITCPLLSATGRCTVYSVRPFICRVWGTVRTLRCPVGCEPTRWLTTAEAHDIFRRVAEVAGPGIDGPFGGVDDLWGAIALVARERVGGKPPEA